MTCRLSLVAVKRDWVPERLYRVLCKTVQPLMTKQPLRWLLHTEVDEFTAYRINRR